MIIIPNKFIPWSGFAGINLFGILFIRSGIIPNDRLICHESIHTKQIVECGFIFFYIWYLIEWFIRLFLPGNAYWNISFEQEAYSNEQDTNYLNNRKHFSWIKYL